MIFIWGKKVVRRSIGYVADFCPVCRDLTCFKVRRIGLAGHFYYISLGEGALISHVRTCSECGVDLNARPETYKSIGKKRLEARELANSTRPDWQQVHASRLSLEREVATAADRLPPDVRKALIREPFELLAPRVEDHFARANLDAWSWGAIAMLFVLLFIAAKLVNQFPSQPDWIFGGALVIGIAGIVWQLMGRKKRFFEKDVFPVLRRALYPLRPTIAELGGVVSEMQAAGKKIGKLLDVNALARSMGAASRPSSVLSDPDEMESSRAAG